MAAVAKTSIQILAPTVITPAQAGTEAAPGLVGLWIDVSAVNGGLLGGLIENTGGAVGLAGQMKWQWTPDKDAGVVKIYDLWGSFGGALGSNAKASASTRLDKEARWVRAVCWGNTLSSVTYGSDLAASS